MIRNKYILFQIQIALLSIYLCLNTYLGSVFSKLQILNVCILMLCLTISIVNTFITIDVHKVPLVALLWTFCFLVIFLSLISVGHLLSQTSLRLLVLAMFILARPKTISVYKIGLYILLIFAFFQALGVYLEFFNYNYWWKLVNSVFGSSINDLGFILITKSRNVGYLTGFSLNSGFTATYIINGIYSLGLLYFINKGERGGLYNVKYLLILITLIFSLILTGKRGQLLFLILSFTCTYIICARNDKTRIIRTIKIIILVIILYIIGYVLYLNRFEMFGVERILKLIYSDNTLDKTSGRIILWKLAFSDFLKEPIFGIGWLNFEIKYGLEVHNTYLQMMTEIGIIGLIAFLSALLTTFISAFRNLKYRIGVNAIVLSYIIYYSIFSLVENSLVNVEPLFMLVLVVSLMLQIRTAKHGIKNWYVKTN